MNIINSKENKQDIPLVMLVYGMGGVGKSTFASTFPNPILLDFENGSKYFGNRGISIDVAVFDKWFCEADKKQLKAVISDYDTIIVDPIGEAMEKLINSDIFLNRKYRQADGSLTIAAWGAVKDEMRKFIKFLRDTGKNVVIVAHVNEQRDGEQIVKRPAVPTKLADEIVAVVDVCGYMYMVGNERFIYVGGSSDKVVSKDRTGRLPDKLLPKFKFFYEKINRGKGKTTKVTKASKTKAKTSKKSSVNKETKQNKEDEGGVVFDFKTGRLVPVSSLTEQN